MNAITLAQAPWERSERVEPRDTRPMIRRVEAALSGEPQTPLDIARSLDATDRLSTVRVALSKLCANGKAEAVGARRMGSVGGPEKLWVRA